MFWFKHVLFYKITIIHFYTTRTFKGSKLKTKLIQPPVERRLQNWTNQLFQFISNSLLDDKNLPPSREKKLQ